MFWLIFENLGIKCWFVFKFSKTLKINLIYYAAKAAQGWSFVGFCGPKQKVQNRLEPCVERPSMLWMTFIKSKVNSIHDSVWQYRHIVYEGCTYSHVDWFAHLSWMDGWLTSIHHGWKKSCMDGCRSLFRTQSYFENHWIFF